MNLKTANALGITVPRSILARGIREARRHAAAPFRPGHPDQHDDADQPLDDTDAMIEIEAIVVVDD